MMKKIIFNDTIGISKEFYPKPSSQEIPQWYKELGSYINDEKKPLDDYGTTSTIKKCMPVFDAITSGYILYTYVDIFVSKKYKNVEGPIVHELEYYWPSLNPIQFHPVSQAPNYPQKVDGSLYPKFINPWSIKTEKGYSSLFLPPLHRDSIFTIMPGVVDTDKYILPVNFPFTFNDPEFEGLIPAGTPMAQVIPFKRDDWKILINKKNISKEQHEVELTLRSRFFESYKNSFRVKKNYK